MSDWFDDPALDPEVREAGRVLQGGIQATGLVANGVLNIVAKIIEGVFRLGEGIATGNVDVVATAAVVGTGIAMYLYFVNTEPYATILRKLKLDVFHDILVNGFMALTQGNPDTIGKLSGSIADEAQKCIDKFTKAGLTAPPYWFQLRDSARAAVTLDKFDNSLVGQLLTFGVPTL